MKEAAHRRFVRLIQKQTGKFCKRGGLTPFSCRKYLRKAISVFRKIYAHKWLYTAFCGHNIFLVTISWSGLRDSNPPHSPWEGDALPDELNPQADIGLTVVSFGHWAKCSVFSIFKRRQSRLLKIGADYEARTRYLHLGKVALYQMS